MGIILVIRTCMTAPTDQGWKNIEHDYIMLNSKGADMCKCLNQKTVVPHFTTEINIS